MSSHDTTPMETEEPYGLACALEAFTEFNEVCEIIDNLKSIYTNLRQQERAYERFLFIFNQYKEQPHLLDKNLDEILEKIITIIRDDGSPVELKHCLFNYMFVIVNVRGYKVIVRHLPHEVADFEPVLKLLEAQDSNDADSWTTRYILLLWLSIIVMIPFDLSRFDADRNDQSIMSRVLEIIKTYVVQPDKCRDGATYLSAKFLNRNDVKVVHLESYLDWALNLGLSENSKTYVKDGVLSSISMIFKHGKREDLLPHAQKLLHRVVNEKNDNKSNNDGPIVQKLFYKIIQRIGLTFLPPRVAAWRYKRGNRLLASNLSGGDVTNTISTTTTNEETVNDDDDNIEVPDEIEEVIDQLVQGLRSPVGIVRWSAAKGIGRVTGRLPKDLADDVVGSVLELFTPREGDSAWHGGCLALAELGRRGLLLPKRLPEVVPVILKALVYDEPRPSFSVGSHVRDAACYVCWSFARAYETHDLQPFVNEISATLLIVTCFDREINCRRAASAAFQENVGRQGSFPHGIEILTVADFFAVNIRSNAYLNISTFIAQFDEYTVPLIDHLLTRKVEHWDLVIRELTAKSLNNLTPLAPQYMVEKVLPSFFDKAICIDMNSRHGSVLAIGEILYALSQLDNRTIETIIGDELVESVKNLIQLFRTKFYFRGTGGELTRQACCDFIEKCSLAHFNFHNSPIIDDWLHLINECISYNVPNIQKAAVKALPALLSEYYQNQQIKRDQIVRNYIHELLSTNSEDVRMGYSLALGALPEFILKTNLGKIVDALIESAKITSHTEKWAKGRRDSIKALTDLCKTISNEIGNIFNIEIIMKIYNTFLIGLQDYTQDRSKGDIGAWVREASMLGLQSITVEVVERKSDIISCDLMEKIMSGVAQQAVEKIDRTRALAAKVFYGFLHNETTIPNIPHYEQLIEIFVKDELDTLNWNSAADTFPKFVELLRFQPYTYNVMLGIICSIGGLTETLVKNCSSAFFNYLTTIEKTNGSDEIQRLCDVIYQIFIDYQKIDRVTIPILKFLDKIFSSGCIRCVIDNPDNDFPIKILKLVTQEIAGCGNIYKLIDGINVFSQYVQIKNNSCESALVQLSIFLCHRQPYVRRSTASILYEALLVYGDTANIKIENLDEIMQILSNVNWENSVEELRPIRNDLCNLMGIRTPVYKKKE